MSGEISVADDMLRSFFERWQRLEDEKRTISDDLKELFAEAKGGGFDTKTMRAVFRDMIKDQADMQEAEAIYDLYWLSLNRPRAHPAHVRVEKIEENRETDAAKTLPGIATLGRPATENRSDKEPAIDGSGGVSGQVATHSATIAESEDA